MSEEMEFTIKFSLLNSTVMPEKRPLLYEYRGITFSMVGASGTDHRIS